MRLFELIENDVIPFHQGIKRTDIDIPAGYSSFFIKQTPSGRAYHIMGVKANGQEVQLSTTPSVELAHQLTRHYNSGGHARTSIEKVPLSTVFTEEGNDMALKSFMFSYISALNDSISRTEDIIESEEYSKLISVYPRISNWLYNDFLSKRKELSLQGIAKKLKMIDLSLVGKNNEKSWNMFKQIGSILGSLSQSLRLIEISKQIQSKLDLLKKNLEEIRQRWKEEKANDNETLDDIKNKRDKEDYRLQKRLTGTQVSQAEDMVNQILSRLPRKIASEIRPEVHRRGDDKLQFLMRSLKNRGIA